MSRISPDNKFQKSICRKIECESYFFTRDSKPSKNLKILRYGLHCNLYCKGCRAIEPAIYFDVNVSNLIQTPMDPNHILFELKFKPSSK